MRNSLRRTLMTAALGGAFALPLAALVLPIHAENAPVPIPIAITIDNFTFNPQKLTVKAGTTVTWTNMDDIPHAIAAVSKQFKSKTLDTDDAYSFTFTTPGSYEYFCSLHPHMTGTVVVEAAAGENTTQ
jgi:amicyanin